MKSKNNVILYGTQSCPWCHVTRDYLKEHKVNFKYVDVGQDSKAAMEMIQKSGQQGVPVIDVNGKIVVGFNESMLKSLLGIK